MLIYDTLIQSFTIYCVIMLISFIVEEVPNEDYTIPLSEAEVITEGFACIHTYLGDRAYIIALLLLSGCGLQ